MPRPLAAVFDLDGTLVDNMAFHGEAWVRLARRLGSEATREQFEQTWAGKTSQEVLTLVLGRPPSPQELVRLSEEKEADYRAVFGPRLAPLAGLPAFLDRLAARGVRLAVATAAPKANRDFVLGGLDLLRRFEVVVGPEQVTRGKPWPDLFLAAARGLGLEGSRCLAFEDAVHGVSAALAAGMTAAAVLTTTRREALEAAGASFVLRDYSSLPPALEALLFGEAA
jgi:HAD superfamily hydrolase (TIGR01509 family)